MYVVRGPGEETGDDRINSYDLEKYCAVVTVFVPRSWRRETIYVGSGPGDDRINKPPTEENGVTCRGEKCAERSHQPTAFVLITEIGGNDAENEGACIRRYLIIKVSPVRPLTAYWQQLR